VLGAMLALAAGLAAACFVRAYGTVFLGRPRSPEAANAHEAPFAQTLAIGLLAVLCILGGLFGGLTAFALNPLLVEYAGAAAAINTQTGPTPFSLIAFDQGRAIYDAPTIAFFVAVSAFATMAAIHLFASKKTRRSPAWDCGFPDPSPATQYTASSYSQPLRRVYGGVVYSSTETVDMPPPGSLREGHFHIRFSDYIWRFLYVMPANALWSLSERFDLIHYLTIRRYLVLMFSTLIVLLVITATFM
jgi:NADH:ubiquinone oxidoreductase subunit 5 (subunit L)/multisubunit Na+/H+ antiporter MnhA subunit